MSRMGLREQKKEETRRMLLQRARELFEEKGYQQVTTAEIARTAHIAEGTLFNYYRSKGELFIAAVMPDSAMENTERSILEVVSPEQLAISVAALLDQALAPFKQVSKRMLRDYLTIVYGGGLSEAAEARASLFAADERILRHIIDFLATQKSAHVGQMADFDVELAATCLFGCVLTLFSQYILLEDWTYEKLMQSLHDQTLFIFKGHVVGA